MGDVATVGGAYGKFNGVICDCGYASSRSIGGARGLTVNNSCGVIIGGTWCQIGGGVSGSYTWDSGGACSQTTHGTCGWTVCGTCGQNSGRSGSRCGWTDGVVCS